MIAREPVSSTRELMSSFARPQAGGNEECVGRAVRDSGVPREEVFVTTKFYPAHRDLTADAEQACGASATLRSRGPRTEHTGPRGSPGRLQRPCECNLERLVDRLRTAIHIENVMSRAWVVKHASEKPGEVVPRNVAAERHRLDAHSTSPGIVC